MLPAFDHLFRPLIHQIFLSSLQPLWRIMATDSVELAVEVVVRHPCNGNDVLFARWKSQGKVRLDQVFQSFSTSSFYLVYFIYMRDIFIKFCRFCSRDWYIIRFWMIHLFKRISVKILVQILHKNFVLCRVADPNCWRGIFLIYFNNFGVRRRQLINFGGKKKFDEICIEKQVLRTILFRAILTFFEKYTNIRHDR